MGYLTLLSTVVISLSLCISMGDGHVVTISQTGAFSLGFFNFL